jgi:hypothetical protein
MMNLIQSARMNGSNPNAYLEDVLTQLPTQKSSKIGQLLPYQGSGLIGAKGISRTLTMEWLSCNHLTV